MSTQLNEDLVDAIECGNESTVKFLLQVGADPNLRKGLGFVPLMFACRDGYPDAVDLLLEAGAVVDIKKDDEWTSLMLALFNGKLDIAKKLLDAGANPYVVDKCGRTMLDKFKIERMHSHVDNSYAVNTFLKEAGIDIKGNHMLVLGNYGEES